MGYDSLPSKIKERMHIVYEDDGLSAKNSVGVLNKLISLNEVDVVINLSSVTAKALSPITESKRIPLIAIASDATIVQGKKYAFNLWVIPEEEVKAMLPEIKKRGYKQIVRVSSLDDGSQAVKKVFDALAKDQVEIILDEDFTPDTRDFKPFITKVRAHKNNVDAVMVVLLPGQMNIFAKQLRQLGVKAQIFGFENLENPEEVKLSGGTLVGAWYVNANDGNNAFLSAYQKEFPGASSFPAANGYDAIKILGKAIEQGIKKEDIHKYLQTLKDFAGALGTYSATGDQRFSLPATIKVVTENGFKKLSE